MVEMGLLGDFSKGFVIMIGVFCTFAIVGFIVSGLIETTLVFLLTLTIPLSVMVFEYWKNKKKEKTQPQERAT